MRVPAGHMGVAPHGGPVEVVRRREDVVTVAAGVEERSGPTVGAQRPAQDTDVLGGLPGTEDGEQPAVDAPQPEQPGVAVVAVQAGELPYEGLVVQEPGLRLLQAGFAEGEHVTDPGVGPRARTALEAEQQAPAHGDQIAGHRGVPRVHLFGGEQAQPRGPELLGPAAVERLGPPDQLAGLLAEPSPEHLVGIRIGIGEGDVAVHA